MGMTKECQIRTWREIGYKVILESCHLSLPEGGHELS